MHEQDGTVRADILQPPLKPEPLVEPDETPPEQPRRRRRRPELVELEATGFVPGEEIAVLLGRISGTTAVRLLT